MKHNVYCVVIEYLNLKGLRYIIDDKKLMIGDTLKLPDLEKFDVAA